MSEDGTKQDNAVHTAVQQIVNGFLPCCLERMFTYNLDFRNVVDPGDELRFTPHVTALVPMIVTNAMLYRLKPEVTDLDAIRDASSPGDIADEVAWTWYYYDAPARLEDQNFDAIQAHTKKAAELIYRFPNLEEAMHQFEDRPNWIAVVNIKSLRMASDKILQQFSRLETREVASMLRPPRRGNGKRQKPRS